MSESEESVEEFITVEDLKPNSRRVNLKVKVISKEEEREVISKRTGETLRVTEALIGDETATVLLNLWNELIDEIQPNKIYQINNGYVTLFKGNIRLNIGKFGTIKEITNEDIGEVNNEKNISDEKFEAAQFRSRNFKRGYRPDFKKPFKKRY